jgi:hypothetical protein
MDFQRIAEELYDENAQLKLDLFEANEIINDLRRELASLKVVARPCWYRMAEEQACQKP